MNAKGKGKEKRTTERKSASRPKDKGDCVGDHGLVNGRRVVVQVVT